MAVAFGRSHIELEITGDLDRSAPRRLPAIASHPVESAREIIDMSKHFTRAQRKRRYWATNGRRCAR